MPRFVKHESKGAGLPPGSLIHVGERRVESVRITVIDYDEHHFEEKQVGSIEECLPYRETPTVTWINVDGIHDTELIERIGHHFALHPLVLEDVLNTGQRPKMEDAESYILLLLKMLCYEDEDDAVRAEQVSIVLGSKFVISFQEQQGDVFEAIRERIRKDRGRVRKAGADYLAYALMDAIVDGYFLVLEKVSETVERLEDEVVTTPSPMTLRSVHRLKTEMLFLRKSVWPLREVISGLQRGESPLICESTGIYLRDVYDHTIQVVDTMETFRDMLSGMIDTYLSSISNKMNEVMKVLTIIATIFIPLTFVAGIYGMNFEYMPELKWPWAYFGVWGVMAAITLSMIQYFKRKKWL
jgi:magnesium transporter